MDKTLELPQKIDDKLLELMGKHIDVGGEDKKEGEPHRKPFTVSAKCQGRLAKDRKDIQRKIQPASFHNILVKEEPLFKMLD